MKTLFTNLILLFSINCFAQVDPIDKNGIVLGGYDVVAYFESGKAIKGNKQYVLSFNNMNYLFSTKENQKAFEAVPEKYLPAFDGYCALAVSYGKKISVDPQTFKIIDGKLYLFYNGKAGNKKVNSLETWNKNEVRLLTKANQLWPEVKNRKYRPPDTL